MAEKWMNPVDNYWNGVASELIASSDFSEETAAQLLTFLNVAIMDAAVTWFETKYHYQYPRPPSWIQLFQWR